MKVIKSWVVTAVMVIATYGLSFGGGIERAAMLLLWAYTLLSFAVCWFLFSDDIALKAKETARNAGLIRARLQKVIWLICILAFAYFEKMGLAVVAMIAWVVSWAAMARDIPSPSKEVK